MALGYRRRSASALECVLAATIVLTLMVVAVRQMGDAAREAEWARHVGAVNDLRSALMLHAMLALVRGERSKLCALPGVNPATLAPWVPIAYGGELGPGRAARLDGGLWYFDPGRRTLVYVPMWRAPGTRLAAPLHYRVRLLFDDADGDGRFAAAADRFRGVTLERHAADGSPSRRGGGSTSCETPGA